MKFHKNALRWTLVNAPHVHLLLSKNFSLGEYCAALDAYLVRLLGAKSKWNLFVRCILHSMPYINRSGFRRDSQDDFLVITHFLELALSSR